MAGGAAEQSLLHRGKVALMTRFYVPDTTSIHLISEFCLWSSVMNSSLESVRSGTQTQTHPGIPAHSSVPQDPR